MFQGIKGGLTRRRPIPSQVLLREVDERASDVRVAGNELSIEVGEAEEGMHIFDFSQGGPACNAVELNRIHGQLSWLDDHPKIFNFISGKFALFKLQMEI